MSRRALPFASSGQHKTGDSPPPATPIVVPPIASANAVSVAELPFLINDWLSDCQYQQHTAATIAVRRITLGKFLWFVQKRGFQTVDTSELRQFFSYLTTGHTEPGGRWGNPQLTTPMRPVTAHTYHNHLRSFFSWLVKDGTVPASSMRRISAPTVRTDQIRPLSPNDLDALFKAARASYNPVRNEAILYLLLDCGLRASELCSLKMKDIDLEHRRCVILGKGQKYRTAWFGRNAAKALRKHLKDQKGDPESPLFLSDSGKQTREGLQRRGLHLMVQKLGREAGIKSVRCSPHTLRHTFAVEFLRGGGNVFTLKELMAHETLAVTNRYVMLAEADLENQHRMYSPADRLRKSK